MTLKARARWDWKHRAMQGLFTAQRPQAPPDVDLGIMQLTSLAFLFLAIDLQGSISKDRQLAENGTRAWYGRYLVGFEDISLRILTDYEFSYDCPKPS